MGDHAPLDMTTSSSAYRAARLRSCRTTTIVVPQVAVEFAQQVEHLDLVTQVEERGRLVQQQHLRILCERHGDPHPLPLSARQVADGTVGELRHAGACHRLVDVRGVSAPPALEDTAVGIPAARDELRHRDPVRGGRMLRQQAHDASERSAQDRRHVLAVELDARRPSAAGAERARREASTCRTRWRR